VHSLNAEDNDAARDCEIVACKSEQQKRRLAQAITDEVMKVLHYGEESVAFEEVDANEWANRVYQPNIVRTADTLYKKPGYTL